MFFFREQKCAGARTGGFAHSRAPLPSPLPAILFEAGAPVMRSSKDTSSSLQYPQKNASNRHKSRASSANKMCRELKALCLGSNKMLSAERVIQQMKDQGIHPTLKTYNLLMKGYVIDRDCEGARSIMERMATSVPKVHPNTVTYNQMILVYAIHRNIPMAESTLREMMAELPVVYPNAETYNILLKLYYKTHRLDAAERVVRRMKARNVHPSFATYMTLMKVYARRGQAERVFNEMAKADPPLLPTTAMLNSLLTIYVDRGYTQGVERTMWRMHRSQPLGRPNITTYNILARLGRYRPTPPVCAGPQPPPIHVVPWCHVPMMNACRPRWGPVVAHGPLPVYVRPPPNARHIGSPVPPMVHCRVPLPRTYPVKSSHKETDAQMHPKNRTPPVALPMRCGSARKSSMRSVSPGFGSLVLGMLGKTPWGPAAAMAR